MKTSSTSTLRLSLAAACFSVSALALAPHAYADTATSPAAQMDTSAATQSHDVEDRIKSLHDQLMITGAEETQWAKVADVMRDNASDMKAKIEERGNNAAAMTAVDDIKSFQAITQAHADGLKKLAGAFGSLYSDMSPDQQKTADNVFGHRLEEDAKKSKGG